MIEHKLKIGLTGGIGSGKSYVASLWEQWGASVIDTDVIAHQLTAPGGAAIPAIRKQFGDEYIDDAGAMCRASMRDLVFNQPKQRERLQTILHPLIRLFTIREVEQAQGCYVVVVIPLLVESGTWHKQVDQVCVVDCDEQTQIQRVLQRNGLPLQQIKQIIQSQATREQRLAVADHVISNGYQVSLKELTEQAHHLHKQWCITQHSEKE